MDFTTTIKGDALLLSVHRMPNVSKLNLDAVGIETHRSGIIVTERGRTSVKHMPWCTYTDPEHAHVGATETELQHKGASYETYKFPFSKVDRALTDRESTSWIKVYAKKWNGRILGVDILGAHAGDMLDEWVLALKNKISLRKMADTIHPFPTYSLGN